MGNKKEYDGYVRIRVRHIFLGISGLLLMKLLIYEPTWFVVGAFIFNFIFWLIYRWVDKESGIK